MKRSAIALSSLSIVLAASQANADCNRASTQATTPTSRFAISDDGRTVTDSKTGLVWMRCTTGSAWNPTTSECANSSRTNTGMAWNVALQQPDLINESGGYGGASNWRLPNIKELTSIVEYQCRAPAVNQEVFPNIDSTIIWSSTPSRLASQTYAVDFLNGNVFNQTRTGKTSNGQHVIGVMLVRDK